ncbi:uncharacterized protein Nmlp_1661 [Natronomonas moolapensis 8.8.11]|uniref:DUF8151 domain-containing protein n=1 Tax=Natronomonas moolapensis (strain DSM 18674 / CECT 7526 / JCM 14361 / 8.8.11) TaxID=268739 RepID=M1XP96_NATM8|nr:hypothetical protein [Natronomonas moolapensis]CCQ35856.1 uncharacterized protein Nmlp_1661 [Natronomonas moolapensis 8.8.11]
MKEILAPVVELVAYAVATAAFTVAGVFAELTSVDYLAAGNTTFAAWLVVMGAVALYAGVVALGAGELLPRVRDTVADGR